MVGPTGPTGATGPTGILNGGRAFVSGRGIGLLMMIGMLERFGPIFILTRRLEMTFGGT